MAQHVRLGLVATETILLYHAHPIAEAIKTSCSRRQGQNELKLLGNIAVSWRPSAGLISSYKLQTSILL
jgi:hypothetical protein